MSRPVLGKAEVKQQKADIIAPMSAAEGKLRKAVGQASSFGCSQLKTYGPWRTVGLWLFGLLRHILTKMLRAAEAAEFGSGYSVLRRQCGRSGIAGDTVAVDRDLVLPIASSFNDQGIHTDP